MMGSAIKAAAMAIALAMTHVVAAQAQSGPLAQLTMRNGATQAVTRTVPGDFDLVGAYADMDVPVTMLVLRADGTGEWRGDTKEGTKPITWWVAADASGKALTNFVQLGQAHTLIVDFGGGEYAGFELAIVPGSREIWVNRDRVRRY